jgi:hypothetical protein
MADQLGKEVSTAFRCPDDAARNIIRVHRSERARLKITEGKSAARSLVKQ